MSETWFERLTGFSEQSYAETKAQLAMSGDRLLSKANGKSYGVGRFEVPSLGELRARVGDGKAEGRLRFSNVIGDVRELHGAHEYAGALFQVASQFNMLEMVGPDVTPEQGVTRYIHDRTQGPACAIAAGAATMFRNYFAPVDGESGQTRDRQIDGLADLGSAIAERVGKPVAELYEMRNGYALGKASGVNAIADLLRGSTEAERDTLRAALRIGLHQDVEVTDASSPGPLVSQAFCSALPVSYSRAHGADWAPFATLVLEAAYEATLLAGVLSARRGGSDVVLLTRLGGGAFGNTDTWIDEAMLWALKRVEAHGLDVRLVNYGGVPHSMRELETLFA